MEKKNRFMLTEERYSSLVQEEQIYLLWNYAVNTNSLVEEFSQQLSPDDSLILFWSIPELPSRARGKVANFKCSSVYVFYFVLLSAMPVIYHSVVPSDFLRATFWRFSLKYSLDLSLSHFSCLHLFFFKEKRTFPLFSLSIKSELCIFFSSLSKILMIQLFPCFLILFNFLLCLRKQILNITVLIPFNICFFLLQNIPRV